MKEVYELVPESEDSKTFYLSDCLLLNGQKMSYHKHENQMSTKTFCIIAVCFSHVYATPLVLKRN